MADIQKPALDVEGPAAPPRRNGELVFQAPWEGRAFGLAVALSDAGRFPWEAFRQRLIAAIARADRLPEGQDRPDYYENWLAALTRLLVGNGFVNEDEIEERIRQFACGDRDIADPGAASRRLPTS